ncbi:MAG TPA: hypothetical protein P5531_09910 [Bacteroidales bacterium]|nr:hypothetical protein [Bacteroidales bacterium]HSA43952.1 hypothetical protein [Bacteroidales bacterium]
MKQGLVQHGNIILISLTGLILLWVSLNINGKKDYGHGLVEADAKGYYAWLPAILIYHDPGFGFFDHIEREKYYNPNLFYEYRTQHQGQPINKYWAGTALCQLPFFLAGHTLTLLSDYPADGYSLYYVKSVSFAGIVYVLISIFLIITILAYFQISRKNSLLVITALVFGTNLFYYTVIEFGMSHVYSLAFISLWILSLLRFMEREKMKYLLIMGFATGMLILIRPVNILILASLGFVSGNPAGFAKAAFRKPRALTAAVLLAIGVVSLQGVLFMLQTGDFFVYTYKGEGFNWLHPRMLDILFSWKKGLFLYTPLYLLALTGLVVLWKKDRRRFWWWWMFFILQLYVFSSWHNWYYGGSFSGRAYVEYLPLFGILLALSLQHLQPRPLRFIITGMTLLLIILCQIQTYQYRHGQIHWSDQTREKYLENFLRIDRL